MRAAAILSSLITLYGARAAADPVSLGVRSPVAAPDRPALVVKAGEDLRAVTVALQPGKPQTEGPGADTPEAAPFRGTRPRLPAGTEAVFPLGSGRPGRTLWTGTLSAIVGGKPLERTISVETLVTPNLQLRYDYAHYHPEARYLEFQSTRPVKSASVRVLGETGAELGAGERPGPGAAGTWLRVPWTQATEGKILRLDLTVVDSAGFPKRVQLVPWSESIPHEEVNFATGSWELLPGEATKLADSARKIAAVVARVKAHISPRLYVAGHTDTVGSDADNLTLSRNRARAIAERLQKAGLDVPVLYAGFGERHLRVQTGDNVDELRNRRADYVVAVDPPQGGDWQKLP